MAGDLRRSAGWRWRSASGPSERWRRILDRRAVRGAAGLVLGDVAHALRGRPLQLAAGALERAHGGHLLRPVVLRAARAGRPRRRRREAARFPRRAGRRRSRGAAAAAVARPAQARAAAGDVFVERWSWAMGQPVHLQLFAASEARGYEAAAGGAGGAPAGRGRALPVRRRERSRRSSTARAGRGRSRSGADLAAVLEARRSASSARPAAPSTRRSSR